jgi:hypothetical protein
MELAVSTDYVNGWRFLIGREIGDGLVGFFGATSSLLILTEGVRNAFNQLNNK